MSTRIIIEKDGERYVANELTARFIDVGMALGIENKINYDYITSTYTRLPPVIRTDNSETIANLQRIIVKRDESIRVLQRENAKMKDEYDKLIKHKNELIFVCDDYKEENAKLREALKPVLEVKMSAERINSYRIHELHVETFSAVRKAQEILAHGCASTQEVRNDHQA